MKIEQQACRMSAEGIARENAEILERKSLSYLKLAEFIRLHKDSMDKEVEELLWSLCVSKSGSYYS